MIRKGMLKEYLKYIIPSMVAFTLTSIYSIIDGIFVGNVVGDAGLAGINIAFPLIALVMAVGTGIGMGGAVISSIAYGSGDKTSSRKAIGNTLIMLLIASLPLTAIMFIFPEELNYLIGGRGETLNQASQYTAAIAWGVPFQVITMGCLPLIRNKGRVGLAMVISIIAGFVNLVLDYVFIVELLWGTAGAAYATAIAQVFSCVCCFVFFAVKSNRIKLADLRLRKAFVGHAITLGLAPFGLALLPEATVVAININASMYGGELAVAAYAVISYTAVVIQMLIQGVGDGSQPLISRCFGAQSYDDVKRIRNTNYVITISIGVLGLVAMYVLRNQIPVLFGSSPEAAVLIAYALPIFAIAYIFYGFTHASTSFFYAIDDARASNTIVYGEALLVIAAVFGGGFLFGLEGIWRSVAVVQFMLTFIAFFFLRRSAKKLKTAQGELREAAFDEGEESLAFPAQLSGVSPKN